MLNIIQIIYLTIRNSKRNNTKIFSKYKKEKWTEAFEKAKGNVDKAYEIYTKDAYFY